LIVGIDEKSVYLRQRSQLTVLAIEDRKFSGRIESAAALKRTDGRQGRCPPSVCDDTKAKARARSERGILQYRDEALNGMQSQLY
jgi:hypothetical protein